MNKLQQPFSELFTTDKPKVEEICKGTSFNNKFEMFGIVEATFGGQPGYLSRIVKEDLVTKG